MGGGTALAVVWGLVTDVSLGGDFLGGPGSPPLETYFPGHFKYTSIAVSNRQRALTFIYKLSREHTCHHNPQAYSESMSKTKSFLRFFSFFITSGILKQ